jgi:hypothetical protein
MMPCNILLIVFVKWNSSFKKKTDNIALRKVENVDKLIHNVYFGQFMQAMGRETTG